MILAAIRELGELSVESCGNASVNEVGVFRGRKMGDVVVMVVVAVVEYRCLGCIL